MGRRTRDGSASGASQALEQLRNMHVELRNLYHLCYEIDAPGQEIVQGMVGSILDRIERIDMFPRKRMELLNVCYGIDTYLSLHGCVPVASWNDVYGWMTRLFWDLARSVGDQHWIAGLLCEQLRFDAMGWHLPLIVGAGDFLADEQLSFVIDRLMEFARHEQRRESYLYLAGYLSRIVDRFNEYSEQVVALYNDDPPPSQCLYIADALSDSDPKQAMEWLDRIQAKVLPGDQEIVRLRILRTCFHVLEKWNQEEAVARALFRIRYTLADAKQLFDAIPADRLDAAVSAEVEYCFSCKGIHPGMMLFLCLYAGFGTLDRYVLSHIDDLNEFAYSDFSHAELLPHAMNLEDSGYYASATVLYRIMVLNILVRRLDQQAQRRGVDYLVRLGRLSRLMGSWRRTGFSHSQYLRFLKKNYSDIASFWSGYDEAVASH